MARKKKLNIAKELKNLRNRQKRGLIPYWTIDYVPRKKYKDINGERKLVTVERIRVLRSVMWEARTGMDI